MRTLWVLAVLTKRQLIDDAVYLVPTVVFFVVFVPAVIAAVLTGDFTAPSSYMVAVFVALPTLICLGSCALGIAQTRADRINGVSGLLSTLSVAPLQVLCARMVVGVLVILIALAPIALAGAIVWQIVRPPAWLVRDWRADVFSGMLLAALTSYGLGLSAGTRASTLVRALAVMPLALLLVLLIVAKGFGWPLLSILLVILVALILESMRSRLPSCVVLGAVGLLAVIFASSAVFWARFLSDAALTRSYPQEIEINPCALLLSKERPSEDSSSPRVHVWRDNWPWGDHYLRGSLFQRHRALSLLCWPFMGSERVLRHLGIVEFVQSRRRGYCCVSSGDGSGTLIDYVHLSYVDGQLVHRHNGTRSLSPTFPWDWQRATERCVGPNGVSEARTCDIGRFGPMLIGASEFVSDDRWSWWPQRYDPNTFVLYEIESRRFFSVDLEKGIVSMGPALESQRDEPVQVGASLGPGACRIDVHLPVLANGAQVVDFAESPYVPVVCESGRIELLDRGWLEIVGPAGTLPRPRTFFGWGSQKPTDLLATEVVLIAVGAPRQNGAVGHQGRGEYIGAVVASVSRQGTSMSVAVFDSQGKMIQSREEEPGPQREYMVSKYLSESLHPPILTLASFFAAYSFEAGATHRALFLMPNSFVALQRDRETSPIFQFLAALLFLLPALAFSGFLGWRVVHDAAAMGLSRRARRWWGLGTLLFGLPAYITYRLMRPKAALALCRDCSRGRRVDMETCHHCGGGWDVPALEPPAWRVTSRL
jgi:hypothetical protein